LCELHRFQVSFILENRQLIATSIRKRETQRCLVLPVRSQEGAVFHNEQQPPLHLVEK
jgi:hypothetical protein